MRTRAAVLAWLTIAAISLTVQGGMPAGATPTANLLLVPSSTTPAVASEVQVQVKIDTGSTNVNAAQTYFNYPANRFTFLGFDDTGSPFDLTGQESAANGVIRIARAKSGTSVSGTNLVTTVRFTAATPGNASLCQQDTSLAIDAATTTGIPLVGAVKVLHIAGASSFDMACLHKNFIATGASNRAVTISGHGFNTALPATLSASGSGTAFASVTVVSNTEMTATVSVSESAAQGARDITLTNGPKSFVCQSCFDVGPGPIVQSSSPATVARGAPNKTLQISGMYIGPSTRVTVARAQVVSTSWVNFQRIDVVVKIAATATTGPATITLTDPYHGSYGYGGRGHCGACLAIT